MSWKVKLKRSFSLIVIFSLLGFGGYLISYQKMNFQFGENPGYFAQWFEEKKNADGIIPAWMHQQWMKWDKSHGLFT